MAEYYTEQLPDFDVGAGRYTTRNARYRHFVCQHFKLKHVSVGGDGNCFFEALSLMLQPQCSAAQLRANCVDLFKQSRESTQVVFERIQQGIEDELHRELVCSKRGSRIDGLKPASVPEYIDAVSHDGVWVQGLHWLRAVSFLYDVRICVVIYGQQFVRFVGTGTSTVYLYNIDGTTHFDPLVPLTGSPEAPHIDNSMGEMLSPGNLKRLERRIMPSPAVITIESDDDCSVRGVVGSQKSNGSPSVSPESSVHGSRPVSPEISVHGSLPGPQESSVHGSLPGPQESSVHGSVRPRRTCRMRTRPPSPDPSPRRKRNAHVKKELSHGSESDDDVPLVRQRAKAKMGARGNHSIPPLSIGTSFIAGDFTEACATLKKRLGEAHSDGIIQIRNSSAQYVYLKCTLCSMSCAAGAKKDNPSCWRITLISDFALQPCRGHSISMSPAVSSLPSAQPPAIPSLVAPIVQNPVTDFPQGPEYECMACFEVKRAALCPKDHAWCITCFASSVETQCDHQGIQKFLQRRGVVCTMCPPAQHGKPWTFDMDKLGVL